MGLVGRWRCFGSARFYCHLRVLVRSGRRTTEPEFSGLSRTVSGNTLFSHNDPPVRMTFDERFEHIGGQKFILYGTADVGQHFFVEEHPDGTLKSIFWIQFEGFLPDNNYIYDYSGSPLRLQIGAFDFYTDTAAGELNRFFRLGWPGTTVISPASSRLTKGIPCRTTTPSAACSHSGRGVNRKELLIIFMEDLAPTRWTGEALREGGEHEGRWPVVESAHP